jgi:large subunit ribosomal protein L30
MPEEADILDMEEKAVEAEVVAPKEHGKKATESPSSQRKPRSPKKPKTEKPVAKEAQEHSQKPSAKKPVQEKHEHKDKSHLFAVVMVRGVVGTNRDLKDTLKMLMLDRINHCVIVPKNPNYEGMLHKARHFVTWGEIDQETIEKLVSKRGRFAGDKRMKDISYAKELAALIISGKKVRETGIKPVFRLSPPSKGYESTKKLYPRGSLGYRGEKMAELIKRMI